MWSLETQAEIAVWPRVASTSFCLQCTPSLTVHACSGLVSDTWEWSTPMQPSRKRTILQPRPVLPWPCVSTITILFLTVDTGYPVDSTVQSFELSKIWLGQLAWQGIQLYSGKWCNLHCCHTELGSAQFRFVRAHVDLFLAPYLLSYWPSIHSFKARCQRCTDFLSLPSYGNVHNPNDNNDQSVWPWPWPWPITMAMNHQWPITDDHEKGTIDDTWIDYIDCDATRRIISLSYSLLWPSRLLGSTWVNLGLLGSTWVYLGHFGLPGLSRPVKNTQTYKWLDLWRRVC